MGNVPTPEALAVRWAEVVEDSALRDLPYKIELNAWGKIEMSPASNRHGLLQARLTSELARQLSGGEVVTECSVLTQIGVRVPDVAWASSNFLDLHGEVTPFPRAPELCIEIVSPSNSQDEIEAKIAAYLAAGAQEVWTVSEEGALRYFDSSGERTSSRFAVKVSLPGPRRR
jgi:Uma2 family endonuclease